MGNGISVEAQKNRRGSRKYAWQSQLKLEEKVSTQKGRFSFLDFLRNKNKSKTANTKNISTQTSVSTFNDR